MAKTDPKSLKISSYGLVPIKMLVDDAGKGFRKDEVRGFEPKIAALLIDNEHGEAVEPVMTPDAYSGQGGTLEQADDAPKKKK